MVGLIPGFAHLPSLPHEASESEMCGSEFYHAGPVLETYPVHSLASAFQ